MRAGVDVVFLSVVTGVSVPSNEPSPEDIMHAYDPTDRDERPEQIIW